MKNAVMNQPPAIEIVKELAKAHPREAYGDYEWPAPVQKQILRSVLEYIKELENEVQRLTDSSAHWMK